MTRKKSLLLVAILFALTAVVAYNTTLQRRWQGAINGGGLTSCLAVESPAAAVEIEKSDSGLCVLAKQQIRVAGALVWLTIIFSICLSYFVDAVPSLRFVVAFGPTFIILLVVQMQPIH